MISYESVHLNSALKTEISRFETFLRLFQGAEYTVSLSLNALNFVQNSIFIVGIFLIAIVCATEISIGASNVGQFVAIITYFIQLQAPLSFFGTWYTMVQNNLIEAERMLELVSSLLCKHSI